MSVMTTSALLRPRGGGLRQPQVSLCELHLGPPQPFRGQFPPLLGTLPFGICQAVMVFGEDDHAVGAYNSKVGNLVGTLCLLCRFNPADANRWAEAASLHDLGKLWIPSDILLKRGSLTRLRGFAGF
jgi:hypothetical protein